MAILIALPLGYPAGRVAPVLVALAIGALAAVNFFGSIRPMRDPANDYWRVRAAWYEANAAPGDLVVATFYLWENYLRYFAGVRVLNLDPLLSVTGGDERTTIATVRRAIAEAGARRVLFSGEVFAPAADAYSRCVGTGPLCQHPDLLHREFRNRSRPIAETPLETVWQLE